MREREETEKKNGSVGRKSINILFLYILTRTTCGPVDKQRVGKWEVQVSNPTSYQNGVFLIYSVGTVYIRYTKSCTVYRADLVFSPKCRLAEKSA